MNEQNDANKLSLPRIYALDCDSDKYAVFVEKGYTDGSMLERPLEESFISQCVAGGGEPFDSIKPPIFEFYLPRGRKMKKLPDFSAFCTDPFLIFSERAKAVLQDYLEPAGQFIEIVAPVPGYIGYYPTLRIPGAFDLAKTKHRITEKGLVMIEPGKEVIVREKAAGHHLFMAEDDPIIVYVSDTFKAAVKKYNLKGLWIWREIPLA